MRDCLNAQLTQTTPPQQLLTLLRQHWSIENRADWPRDVSLHEDRYPGRQIGTALAWLRNMALNLIRRHRPSGFLPDVWSELAANLPIAQRLRVQFRRSCASCTFRHA